MKLEEGMYVRLDTGKIGKIVYLKEKDNYPYSYLRITLDSEKYSRTTRNVIKASHNIIDLIEVGDYVNGNLVTNVIPQDICGDEILDYQHAFIGPKEIYSEDIKSIVTKEQMEAIQYVVK